MSHENLKKYLSYKIHPLYRTGETPDYSRVGIKISFPYAYTVPELENLQKQGIDISDIFTISTSHIKKEDLITDLEKNVETSSYLGGKTAVLIPYNPKETLEARAESIFQKYVNACWLRFESEFEEIAQKQIHLYTINHKNERDNLLKIFKEKLQETKKDREIFIQMMKNALNFLPDTQGTKFEILSMEQAYDEKASGLYCPNKDIIYVGLSDYWTGEILPFNAILDTLAHEAGHGQQKRLVDNGKFSPRDPQNESYGSLINSHSLLFRLLERANSKMLREIPEDILFNGLPDYIKNIYSAFDNKTIKYVAEKLGLKEPVIIKKKTPSIMQRVKKWLNEDPSKKENK